MKAIRSSILSAVLVGVASASGAGEIDVMTQNQYIGADLGLGAQTSDPDTAVVSMLSNIAAQRPAERVRALAAVIKQRNPDVVGLQEAFKFGCMPFPGVPTMPGMGCDDPTIRDAFTDHLQSTEDALRGKYVVAGKVTNLKIDAIPFLVNGYPAVLSIADRDAILVRAGLTAQSVDFTTTPGFCSIPSDQGCNYQNPPVLPLPLPIGDIALKRGFLAVDVTVKGSQYRVFNTHLEQRLLAPDQPGTRLIQVGQASELLAVALGTADGSRTVIVVGDINSDPRDRILAPPPSPYPTPYEIFTSAGFTDTWTLRPRADSGESCCQEADLANRRSELYERIDMIFSLPRPSRVLNMKLLGNTIGDKTSPPGNGGLWPSDHAALAAKLKFN
ncbi:MAG: endonuclease/exonuclease/phosphatase family protein [Nitrospira sp.]|nr:endonuclease/exonuclease/phosphatase family protein [Nitrospira sp.]